MQAVQAATSLVKAYRTHGHLAAHLDPLGSSPIGDPALDPDTVHLTPALMRRIPSKILRIYVAGETLDESLPHLRETYTGTIAYEIEHISNHRQRVWLREQIESGTFRQPLDAERRRWLLRRLISVDALERFMHKAYLGQKQFSIEGLDMTVPMIDEAIELSARAGAREVVIGMAHRGRLNVLAHNLGRRYETIFGEFEGTSTVEVVKAVTEIPQGGTGDVKYHHGFTKEYALRDGSGSVLVNLESNPSHLEFVNPVVLGATRAAQTDRSEAIARARPARGRADRAARRRRLPRPGRRRRDAQPAGARRLPGRRRAAPRAEQPGRLHDRLRGLALDPLGVGPRQGLRRPDHPRQRRRRRGVHLRRAARDGLPRGVRPRRADRPDRLPPLRPQRGRRARLHAAGDVRRDQAPRARREPLRDEPHRARRRHEGRGRRLAAGGLGRPHAPPPGAQGADQGRPGRRHRRAADRRVPARPHAEPAGPDGGPRRPAAHAQRGAADARPRASPSTPSSSSSSRRSARRSARTAASTGRRPRRSRSPRCWSRACRCA